ncbi:MAG TPA: adenylyl cyclase [Streptosporangiaceae bacterium]|nr:adenylyl cyclase [Streptosporangiaceae bacterium]
MNRLISGLDARRRLHRVVPIAAAMLVGVFFAAVSAMPAAAASPVASTAGVVAPSTTGGQFGANVFVFNPSMAQDSIQSTLDSIASQQVSNQFGTQRYAVFFEPGTYGSSADPLIFQVGYYTTVAGLGRSPGDVTINGQVNVYNQCFGTNCIALDNFWRSLSNLTINVTGNKPGGNDCSAATDFWAVSQAAPLRRVQVNGKLSLMDYCDGSPDYASGGFIADSGFTGPAIINGSQQQWITRNSNLGGGWSNGVWNQVFCGDNGAPAQNFGNGGVFTTLATCPVTEEAPFLYTDSQGGSNVFVPAVQHNSVGPASASGTEAGTSIPLSKFFVASPGMSGATITAALARGQNLILTPGVYNLDQPIVVPHPDTVVLGLGMATLVPQRGNAAMIVVRNNGVKLSGFMIDAGPVKSPVLLSVGTPGPSDTSNPDLIQDVFFRIGGAETTPVSATVSLLDNASNSIIDDIWAWRADHGNAVGWTVNTADTGVAVTGNNVTAYGLFAEHYQKNEVIWSGQGGTDIFFQNELPYDPPSQSAWMASPTQDGYPSFLVTRNVKTFQGYGMGSYIVFIQTSATLFDDAAFQAPQTPGVQFHGLLVVYLGGSGGDKSIINDVGGPVTSTSNPGIGTPVDLISYP